jgi:hypothetical protein
MSKTQNGLVLSTKNFLSMRIVAVGATAILALGLVTAYLGGAATNNENLTQAGDEIKDTLIILAAIGVIGAVAVAFISYGKRSRR